MSAGGRMVRMQFAAMRLASGEVNEIFEGRASMSR